MLGDSLTRRLNNILARKYKY